MATELPQSQYGLVTERLYCGTPSQTDDVVLLSLTKYGLQCMMGIEL